MSCIRDAIAPLLRVSTPYRLGLPDVVVLCTPASPRQANWRRRCYVAVGLGKALLRTVMRYGTSWIYPVGETVRLVSDGRDISASIAVQRGPRGGRTVGYCPIPCRLILFVEPLNPTASILSIACYRGQGSIREIFASLLHIP